MLCTPEGENHKETAFFQSYPPNSAVSALPGRDFITGFERKNSSFKESG